MANISTYDPVFVFYALQGTFGNSILYDEIVTTTETELTLSLNGSLLTLTGTGFTYEGTPGQDDFVLTGGEVSGFTLTGNDGEDDVVATDLDLSLTDFNEAVMENALDLFVETLLSKDDVITGSDRNDRLAGGDGDDLLDGGLGVDVMAGGDGNDVYIAERMDTIIEQANGGIDLVKSSTSFTLPRYVENLELTGEAASYGFGNTMNNRIDGNQYSNQLSGFAGNDILNGHDGDDVILGGIGDDTIAGGDGLDQLYGGDGSDIFVFEDHGSGDIDVINDFDIGVDLIDISGVDGIESFADLEAISEQVGEHVIISTQNDSDLIIRDTGFDELSEEMFVFA